MTHLLSKVLMFPFLSLRHDGISSINCIEFRETGLIKDNLHTTLENLILQMLNGFRLKRNAALLNVSNVKGFTSSFEKGRNQKNISSFIGIF